MQLPLWPYVGLCSLMQVPLWPCVGLCSYPFGPMYAYAGTPLALCSRMQPCIVSPLALRPAESPHASAHFDRHGGPSLSLRFRQ